MIERLQRGIEGYEKISRHALSADASARLIAELQSETASGDTKE
jgi:hypothetical protein